MTKEEKSQALRTLHQQIMEVLEGRDQDIQGTALSCAVATLMARRIKAGTLKASRRQLETLLDAHAAIVRVMVASKFTWHPRHSAND